MKNKRVMIFFTIILSAFFVYLISLVIFNNMGKINQGAFRIHDVVVKSTVEYEELENKEGENDGNISGLKFNATQRSKIAFLIEKQKDANRIYIDNITMTIPKYAGDIFISYSDKYKINITELSGKTLEITPNDTGSGYEFEIDIDNIYFLKEKGIENGDIDYLKYDGTMLNHMGISTSDIEIKLKFNLNIEYENKKSICKVNLNIPNDDLIKNGISIYQLETLDFPFYIK